jgi:nucleotide-binding universal stress UspA family protein
MRGSSAEEVSMNKDIRVVVVGVAEMHDGEPGDSPPREDPVLAPAVALAERLGARLHVVQAFDRPDPVLSTYTPALDNGTAVLQRKLQIERCLWAQTRRFSMADRIHCHAVEGRADLQLCAFAEELKADLLIIGATRRGRVRHSLLGSTAEQVLRRAQVPVLLIRRPLAHPVRRVLLSTDLSELASAIHEAALDTVEAICGQEPLEARVLLVCHYNQAISARMSREFATKAAVSGLRQFLAERLHRRTPVSPCIRIGNPSTEIISEAGEWKADLIVLGSHCARGFARLYFGSTAAATLRGSNCNALVIPAAVAAGWQQRHERHRPPHAPELGFPGTEEQTGTRRTLASV